MEKSRVDALLIHAVYLLNAATNDKDMRAKTRASLIASLRAGDALGAHAVVLHPGSALAGKVAAGDQARGQGHRPGAERERALPAAPREHGRHRRDARPLVPGARRPRRRRRRRPSASGLCLDSCHLFASGYDIRTEEGLAQALDECDAAVGPRPSARCTSTTPRRRWAPTATATPTSARASSAAAAAPSSSPSRASTDLPCVLETPGPDRHGPTRAEITLTRRLRSQGSAGGVVRPRRSGGTQGFAALRPRSNSARWCTIARARRRRPPAPGPAVERGVARAKVADAAAACDGFALLHRKKARSSTPFRGTEPPNEDGR